MVRNQGCTRKRVVIIARFDGERAGLPTRIGSRASGDTPARVITSGTGMGNPRGIGSYLRHGHADTDRNDTEYDQDAVIEEGCFHGGMLRTWQGYVMLNAPCVNYIVHLIL